jgi:hypothetical protein
LGFFCTLCFEIILNLTKSQTFFVKLRTTAGVIMARAHRRWPVVGVQFHPESILTDRGYDLLAGFLRLAGLSPAGPLPTIESERPLPPREPNPPDRPVTF